MILGTLDKIVVSLGALGASWKVPGGVLGGCWEHVGGLLELFWTWFGAWKASSKRFAEILKNLEKCCKVLQKSRFGGSRNR